jgi:hypothetical protein
VDYNASNLSHAQREYVGQVIETLHQSEADFISRIEKAKNNNPTNYRGRREPIETGANPSLSFGSPAGGDLATPGAPTLNHYTIPYVWMNLGLGIDYESLLNEAQGTVNAPLRQAIESTAKSMVKWLNIYASQGDGTTKLATSSAAYDGTNATTKKTFVCNGATDTVGATNVVAGQKGYIYDPTGTTQRIGTVGSGVLTISAAQTSKTSILFTTDLPSDYLSGDIFVPEGATPSVGFAGVPQLIAASGTIHGVSRTSVPSTQSTIVAAGGALSAALLFQTYSQIRQRTGKSAAKGAGSVEMCYGITQSAAYYGLTTATAQLLFPRDGNRRPGIDIGGDDPDEFSWFGVRMNVMLDWLGSRIDFINFRHLHIASLKEGGEMLKPFDRPLPQINGTTSTYKAAQVQWWDVARQYFTRAGHRHGALTGLSVSGLPMQKS